jgi:hypothetical protein
VNWRRFSFLLSAIPELLSDDKYKRIQFDIQ